MNHSLAESLNALIQAKGPLPFHRFMGQALYHPESGFYASGQTRTGRGGDFLTPVSPGPVLGELLARQADELHEIFGRYGKIRIIEQGADAGWLARDLLMAIHRLHPELMKAAEFHFIEPHPRLAEKQRGTLGEAGPKAHWHASWETFPSEDIPCFFYSCELVDSFPVRIFRYRAGSWRERLVGFEGADFCWREGEVDAASLKEIRRWNPPEQEGYTLELRPESPAWVQSWATKISRGLVLTLDYGFPSAELFSPQRHDGTLVAFRNHHRAGDPLAAPGHQDLTAHVNFTQLEELGESAGWKTYGLVNFARGLTSLAAPLLRESATLPETWIRNFRHLTHPSFFGHTHRILVQGTSLPKSFTPSILKTF